MREPLIRFKNLMTGTATNSHAHACLFILTRDNTSLYSTLGWSFTTDLSVVIMRFSSIVQYLQYFCIDFNRPEFFTCGRQTDVVTSKFAYDYVSCSDHERAPISVGVWLPFLPSTMQHPLCQQGSAMVIRQSVKY